MRVLKVTITIILFCVLTVLTQVGGVAYLLSLFTNKATDNWTGNKALRATYRVASFLVVYIVVILLIVPAIAKPFGRVRLPLTEKNHLQPLNVFTWFLNRNYVRPEMKQTVFEVAKEMNEKFPGTITNYLDANFPFFDKFPLVPHLSHNDGKKLDLSFCYLDTKTGSPTNECPSIIGYGVCEEPFPNEKNIPEFCAHRGYWQYTLMSKIVSQKDKQNFAFDKEKTKELVSLFASHPAIGKIFIEPHLKTRLNLTSDKIRFHGCQAVRHDDHIHVQLK